MEISRKRSANSHEFCAFGGWTLPLILKRIPTMDAVDEKSVNIKA
jgi:hypothetical protein